MDKGRGDLPMNTVKNYVERKKLTFINLLDPESSVAEKYGVQGIPMSFIINPAGKIVAFVSGYFNWSSKENIAILENITSRMSPKKLVTFKSVYMATKRKVGLFKSVTIHSDEFIKVPSSFCVSLVTINALDILEISINLGCLQAIC